MVNTGVAATLSVLPAGTGVMSKTGFGSLEVISDLSSSVIPIVVCQGALGVSGSNRKLPTASISVISGAVLKLGTAGGTVINGAVPGSANIETGAILSVPNNVFSNPTIHNGVIVKLGSGAHLGQNISVVS